MHCRADNVTCEASPIEFDWEVTGESSHVLSMSHKALLMTALADGALPDINAEFLELQLTLMLEIAEQVGGTGTTECLLACFMHHLRLMGTDEDVLQTRRAIFGSVNSSPVSGKFQFRQNPMLREEGDDRTDDSEMEVEVRKGDESGDVSMDGVIGTFGAPAPLFLPRLPFPLLILLLSQVRQTRGLLSRRAQAPRASRLPRPLLRFA
jgi:hypothetical protein